jgi:hypothetical protein
VHSTLGASLRVESTTYRGETCRLFTLNFPHGLTTAETNSADDAEVLACTVATTQAARAVSAASGYWRGLLQ